MPYETTLPEGLRTICRILILLALIIDLYLAYSGITGDSVIGCGRDSDCDRVLQSKWSKLFGIPVSLFAIPVYIGLLYSAGLIRSSVESQKQRRAWRIIFLWSSLVVGAAIWFIILQFFVIKSICPYCMAAHILGGLASAILLIKAPIIQPSHRWERREKIYISPSRAKRRLVLAATLLGVFILLQIIYTPQTHIVKSINLPAPDETTNQTNPKPVSEQKPTVLTNIVVSNSAVTSISSPQPQTISNAAKPLPVETKTAPSDSARNLFTVQIAGKPFEFNLDEVPVMGSPDAPYKILSLFDYTCHYCRQMHRHLQALISTYGNKIAVINLPTPLDANCNPVMFRTPRAHIGACEYAKIGLAVWRINRSAYAEFDKFVFEGETPPPLEKVKAYAENLVGATNLSSALSDQWVSNMIKLSTSIFSTNALYLGQGQMPQVIIGTNLISGQIQNTGVLVEQLEKQFHISNAK